MVIPDFGPYTIQDLEALLLAAKTALDSKQIVATAESKIDAIIAEVKTAQGFKDKDPWVQPTGAHDSYPAGAHVTYGGKIWENLTSANVWQPGVSGWREYVAPGSVAAWVQPTGSHDVYHLGDLVTHNGKTWRSTNAANVWEPGTVGTEALWAVMP
jgi:Neuraminidase (sialidase)